MIFNTIVDIYRATIVSPPPEMGGDPYPDWDHPTLIASIPASLQPLSTDERLVFKDMATVTMFKIYCRKVDIVSTDQVKLNLNGHFWQVVGSPFYYDFRGTHQHHVKFYIQQVAYEGQ
ncbi:hypothetical protein [Actinomadura rubrisoli]|uniref:Head-tail adaptor protein n=1 Tax=Actinomadura rubrisoli TaxID=2530368 RepID=A0A4R5CB50_9ACTN|nr:hypothetical protein [Actinomadura rubrisoli]TDD97168.1 hypothetical protein E1298_01665 [Actinomadura rubrisoli]